MPIYGLSVSDEQLFPIINVILPAFLMLAIAPGARITQAIVFLSTFICCVLYGALVISKLLAAGSAFDMQSMTTLKGIIALFKDPELVFAGWVHYCASDLWVARWIALDSVKRRFPRLLLAPILLGVMFFGPMGLLAYFLLRAPYKERKAKSA